MPGSSPLGKEFLAERFVSCYPPVRSVLDVGCGYGEYALSWRPMVDEPQRWTAVEIYAPYIARFGLNDTYDRVILGDARNVVSDLNLTGERFDLVILGDVVEHMPAEDGVALIREAMQIARYVVVSIPIGLWPQGAWQGNEHEAHVSVWTHDDVRAAFIEAGEYFGALESRLYDAQISIDENGEPIDTLDVCIGAYWWTKLTEEA